MFSFVYELKGYWAYKYEIRNINFSWFQGKSPRVLRFSAVASTCRNWMLFHRVLSGSKGVSVFADHYRNGLYCLFVPIIVYLMCWFARNCYVKQLQQKLHLRLNTVIFIIILA